MGYQLKHQVRLSTLAEMLQLDFQGLDVLVKSISPLGSCMHGDLTFTKVNTEFPEGVAAITPLESTVVSKERGFLLSKNSRLDFIRALVYLDENIGFAGRDFPAEIHPTALLGKNVVVEPGCKIGENVVLEHNVVIHAGTTIGRNSRIRSCSSVGGDGFGFERLEDGTPLRFPHLGGVVIGEGVEIGSCTAIARGTLSDTFIEDNAKIDNLVHIAHNVIVRRGAFVIACAEISGGVIVGENSWVAPNSCTHQKITIGEGALIGLGAVVTKDVLPFSVYAGNPAKKIRDVSK